MYNNQELRMQHHQTNESKFNDEKMSLFVFYHFFFRFHLFFSIKNFIIIESLFEETESGTLINGSLATFFFFSLFLSLYFSSSDAFIYFDDLFFLPLLLLKRYSEMIATTTLFQRIIFTMDSMAMEARLIFFAALSKWLTKC